MPTVTEQIPTYHAQFDSATLQPAFQASARSVAQKIHANKAIYQSISRKAGGVPYWWIGATHNREASLNFTKHLHEGSPLTARTQNIPKGRPATGSPPFTFEESAIDAIRMPPHSLQNVNRWSVERACYEWERYNGWGYLTRGKASAYVWAGTSAYKGGKFVSDGRFDGSVFDKQLGTVAVLKELALLDPEVAADILDREPGPPKDLIDRETKDSRDGRKIGAGTAAGGVVGEGASQGTQQPDKPAFLSPAITFTAIAVGIAMVIVCTILISRKVALVKSKWG